MGRFIRKNRREGNKRFLSRENDAFVQTAIWSFISSTKNRKMRRKKEKKKEKNQNTNK